MAQATDVTVMLALLIVLLSLGPERSSSSNPFRRRRRRSPPPPPPPPPQPGYVCEFTTGQCEVSNSSNITAADCTETCALPGPCNAPKLVNATQKTLNSVLGLVTTELNHAWPEIVNRTGLDPFTNAVHDLTYDLNHKDGCDEICGAQLASCHSFGLRLHSVDVLGLSSLELGGLELSSLELSSLETCASTPNGTNGSASAVACGFNGAANANASLKVTAQVDIESSGGGIRVECKDAFKKWSELLWKVRFENRFVSLYDCGTLYTVPH